MLPPFSMMNTLHHNYTIPSTLPYLGFGLGLRIPHYEHIFEHWPQVDWFEIISENFMDTDGRPKRNLARIRERYPVVMHGVALSIGTVDPLNSEYLRKLKSLIDFVNPSWISDHLCWTGIAHKNTHDLLPVPYTEEALKHIVSRIKQVQDYLERPIALENPSTYLEFKTSYIGEAEFIARMAEESGCHLLLDVNNVYVSSFNHRLDPKAYIDALPLEKVIQIHLSGHTNKGSHIVDTHDDFVIEDVWSLYKYTTHKAGRIINTMVEWDDKLPPFETLAAELDKAKHAATHAAHYGVLPDLAQEYTPYVANHVAALVQVQSHMQDAILQGDHVDSEPDSWIRNKENFTPSEQLAVYVNGYRYRLYDVTAEDYPVLQYYLGEEIFDEYITAFVDTVASTHFNVSRYSSQLLSFLKNTTPCDAFALELAALESAVAQLTDPDETIPLEPEHLQELTPESLMSTILQPRAALELMEFTYPVNGYYIAMKEGAAPEKPIANASYLAVFRHEDTVWRMELDAHEYFLLKKLFGGIPIGEALESLPLEAGAGSEVLSANLTQWFSRWMRNGLLRYNAA